MSVASCGAYRMQTWYWGAPRPTTRALEVLFFLVLFQTFGPAEHICATDEMFSGQGFAILTMFVLVLALRADSMCLYLSDQAGVGQLDSRLIAAWNCRIVGTGNKLSTKYGFKN